MTVSEWQMIFYILGSLTLLALLIVLITIASLLLKMRAQITNGIRNVQAMRGLVKLSFLRSLLKLIR
jgi:quinol-cytochrome oxidoreductase complex cytochrome b subunit